MIGKIKKVGADMLFHCINTHNIHDAIALLDEKEVDVNCQNINGMTPLHYAVNEQNSVMIETLLKYGADPHIKTHNEIGENTPFHLAVSLNLLDVVEKLLSVENADPTVKNKNGFTMMHIAAKEGYTDMVKKLYAAGKLILYHL